MTRVRFLPEAAEELHAAAQFHEQLHPGLGQALLQEVRFAAERIAENPKAARIERGESEFEASRDFRTESTIESVPGNLWSLPLVIGVANPGFGDIAHSHITNRCTRHLTLSALRCRSRWPASSAGELRR